MWLMIICTMYLMRRKEGFNQICCEDDVQPMLINSHNEKILNIRVVEAHDACNADENRDSYFAEHCINTQQSCSKVVDISIDRKEELKKTMVQREADLNHFEGNTDVSEIFLTVKLQIQVQMGTMWIFSYNIPQMMKLQNKIQ